MNRIGDAIEQLQCAEINCDNAKTFGQLAFVAIVKAQIHEAIKIIEEPLPERVPMQQQDFYENILAELQALRDEVKQMSTSTGAGLAALDQSVIDLTAAVTTETSNVTAATTAIAAALASLASSEDPAVAAQAALIEKQVAAINAANGNLATAVASIPAPAAAPTPAPAPTPGVIPAG